MTRMTALVGFAPFCPSPDRLTTMSLDNPRYRIASWVGVAIAVIGLIIAFALGRWLQSLWLVALLAYAVWQVAWDDRLPDLFDLLLVGQPP